MPVFNNILAGASAQAGGPYHIEHSLKVGRDLSLHKTGLTSSSTYTFSWWAKPVWDHDNNGAQYGMGGGDTCYATINDNKLYLAGSNSDLTSRGDSRFHCHSGWSHVVIKADGSSTKLYVNGQEWVSLGSAPATDNVIIANRSTSNNDDRYAGYIAEFIYQRGVANDPSTYAETDENGTWIPKDPSNLTFGSEDGWYRFNTTDPTVDSSGNGNTLTLNGTVISNSTNFWTNHVQWLDTPTNNFCMLDVNRYQHSSLTDFGVNGSGLYGNVHDGMLLGNMPLTSGKWYYEGMVPSTASTASCMFGLASDDSIYSDSPGSGNTSSGAGAFGGQNVHWFTDGHKRREGIVGQDYGSAASTEDIIGIAFDLDDMKIWVAVNNTWLESGDPANGTNPMWDGGSGGNADGVFDKVFAGDTANPAVDDGNRFWTPFCSNMGNEKIAINFGQALYNGGQRDSDTAAATGAYSFKYTPPSGFKAICTKNLPDVPIECPEKHVEVKYYTHTQASQNISLDFKPDLIWFHQESGDTHVVMVTDSCTKKVYGMGNAVAATSPSDCVTSFNISGGNGFVLGADAGDLGINGENSQTGVAYCWKGGGEPTATNDNAAGAAQDAGSVKVDGADGSFAHGTIRADKMSVNTVAGFSIVSYTGTGTAGTLPHGLGRDPECVMIRNLDADAGDNMVAWNAHMENTTMFGQMTAENGNLTGGRWDQNASNLTNDTFSVGTDHEVNASGNTYVAFVWAPIQQFSAFGECYGHDKGGTGPMADAWECLTGFKPKILLIKRRDTAGNWCLYNNERISTKFNPLNQLMHCNVQRNVLPVTAGYSLDMYNNGYKMTGSDSDLMGSEEWMWWAWADEPMGGANISPATGQ